MASTNDETLICDAVVAALRQFGGYDVETAQGVAPGYVGHFRVVDEPVADPRGGGRPPLENRVVRAVQDGKIVTRWDPTAAGQARPVSVSEHLANSINASHSPAYRNSHHYRPLVGVP